MEDQINSEEGTLMSTPGVNAARRMGVFSVMASEWKCSQCKGLTHIDVEQVNEEPSYCSRCGVRFDVLLVGWPAKQEVGG